MAGRGKRGADRWWWGAAQARGPRWAQAAFPFLGEFRQQAQGRGLGEEVRLFCYSCPCCWRWPWSLDRQCPSNTQILRAWLYTLRAAGPRRVGKLDVQPSAWDRKPSLLTSGSLKIPEQFSESNYCSQSLAFQPLCCHGSGWSLGLWLPLPNACWTAGHCWSASIAALGQPEEHERSLYVPGAQERYCEL